MNSKQSPELQERVLTLETKFDALNSQVTTHAQVLSVHTETLRDVQSEMRHYAGVVRSVTEHLSNNQRRQNFLFQGLGFALVGLLLWVVSRVA